MSFSKQWFLKYQKILLRFCNTWIGRKILCIDGNKSSIGKNKIIHIESNAIWWKTGRKVTAEFRTHDKFGKRLYYAFKPFWYLFHYWDILFANRFIPTLNLGFDSTGNLFPDSGTGGTTTDGNVEQNYALGSGVAFGTIRGDAGNAHDDTSAAIMVTEILSDNVNPNWRRIRRFIATWDTSSIPVGSIINAATLSLRGTASSTADNITNDINIYAATPAANNDLANGDYAQLGTTTFSTTQTNTDWSTTGYNDFVLNANGLNNVTAAGISRFGTKNVTHDAANSAPTWDNSIASSLTANTADQAGTTDDPKLVVTYTPIGGDDFAYTI